MNEDKFYCLFNKILTLKIDASQLTLRGVRC